MVSVIVVAGAGLRHQETACPGHCLVVVTQAGIASDLHRLVRAQLGGLSKGVDVASLRMNGLDPVRRHLEVGFQECQKPQLVTEIEDLIQRHEVEGVPLPVDRVPFYPQANDIEPQLAFDAGEVLAKILGRRTGGAVRGGAVEEGGGDCHRTLLFRDLGEHVFRATRSPGFLTEPYEKPGPGVNIRFGTSDRDGQGRPWGGDVPLDAVELDEDDACEARRLLLTVCRCADTKSPCMSEDEGARSPAMEEWRPEDLANAAKRLKKHVPGIVAVVAIAVLLWGSVYQVPSDSVGVVLRFGRYHTDVQPGLRFKVPLVDQVMKVPIRRQLKQEFGFATPGATNPYQQPKHEDKEKRMVTGDLNAALVEWIIQYRIARPVDFLFRVRNASDTLRDISESVMRQVVGDRTVDEVLTIGRQEIESEALVKMQELAGKYEVGISIDQVQLKNVNPPRAVQNSFDEVNQAQQEKEKLINEARREYNRAIPLAEGEKDKRIQEADGYRLKRVNEAEGDASRFTAQLKEYVKAPEVTRQRLYLETMQDVLPAVTSKVVVDQDAKSVLPLLELDGKKGDRP